MTDYLFASEKKKAEDLFPEFALAKISVQQGMYGNMDGHESIYTLDKFPSKYYCRNPLCKHGGLELAFELEPLLKAMSERGKAKMIKSYLCRGMESQARGLDYDRECSNMFEIKIEVEYKSSEEGES